MTWFGVSVIVSVRLKRGKQSKIPVYENVILVEGRTPKDAAKKAEKLAKAGTKIDDGLTLNNKPAYWSFEGIRKVVTVSNPVHLDLDKDRPVSGTEITYSEFVINRSDLKKLVAGKDVKVSYVG